MSSDPLYPCEYCGNPVGKTTQRGKYQKRFCSIACRNHANAPKRERTEGKICLGCGKYGYRKGDYCRDCLMQLSPERRPNGIPRWSRKDIEYLIEHYPANGAEAVAENLWADHIQVRDKANRLGLCLNQEATDRLVHQAASDYMKANNPMYTQEARKKVKEWRKKHPKIVKRVMQRLFEGHQRLEREQPSGLEYRIREMLREFGVDFEPSYFIKPKFIVDIRIGDLIIQADGDYWHGHPRFEPLTERQKAQKRRDKAQDAYLVKCGYTVVRIWESELTEKRVKAILSKHDIL